MLLDQFEVLYQDRHVQLTAAAQRLIALLALEARTRTRERIAATLWPGADQRRGAANVRRALFTTKRQVPGVIDVSGHGLGLARHVRVDVRDFGLTSTGLSAGLPLPEDFRALEAELLGDWSDPWLVPLREPVHELRLRRLESWAQELLAAGRSQDALDVARVGTRIDPLRESVQRLVVQAQLAEGNRADAVRQYRAYETELWRELRLRPGEELKSLLGLGSGVPAPRARALQRV